MYKMKISRLLAAAALLVAAGSMAADTPKVIAHRGYWKAEGSAQNSIRSIVKADSINCYASEFDVWMTADSVLVVNHDPDINGVHIESSPASRVLAENSPTESKSRLSKPISPQHHTCHHA